MKILLGPPSKTRFKRFVSGTSNASPAGKMAVTGLNFRPEQIIVEWESSGVYYQVVYNTLTYAGADHNTKQNYGVTRLALYEDWVVADGSFSVYPKQNTYGYKAYKYCAFE